MGVELDGDPAVVPDVVQGAHDPPEIQTSPPERQEAAVRVVLEVHVLDAAPVGPYEVRRVAASGLEVRGVGAEVDAGMLEGLRDLLRRLHAGAEVRVEARDQTGLVREGDDSFEPFPQEPVVLLAGAGGTDRAATNDEVFGAETRREPGRIPDAAQLILQDIRVYKVRPGVDGDQLQAEFFHLRAQLLLAPRVLHEVAVEELGALVAGRGDVE